MYYNFKLIPKDKKKMNLFFDNISIFRIFARNLSLKH